MPRWLCHTHYQEFREVCDSEGLTPFARLIPADGLPVPAVPPADPAGALVGVAHLVIGHCSAGQLLEIEEAVRERRLELHWEAVAAPDRQAEPAGRVDVLATTERAG